MALKVKKTATAHIDEGEYTAVISGIQQKEGHFGNYYIWTFILKNALSEGSPVEGICKLTGLTSDKLSPKSKMYKWAKAANLDVDSDEIDLEDALKKRVRVYIEDDEDDSGQTWSKITKVRTAGKKAASAEEEEVEEEAPKQKAKTIKKTTKKKTAPVEEEDDDDIFEDEDDDDEEEEDEAPPPKAKKVKPAAKAKGKAKPKPVEEDEEDEEDDDLFDDEDDEDEDDDD